MKQAPTILVVDDDQNLRKTLGDILRIKGYQPILAGNGAEAIAAMAQPATISLALIDLMLPDMNGLEIMARIKEISPLTEAIILTGHASMETAINATKQGAFSYLLKPYQMDDLLLNIKHGIERQQAQEEILRLASYPRLNPNPVIEIGSSAELTYINPAAEKAFPDLSTAGQLHPQLQGITEISATLRQHDQQESIREIRLGNAVYEQHISYIKEADLIRIYVLDITSRKHAEEALVIREREQAAVAELGSFALSGKELSAVFEHAVELVTQTLEVKFSLILEAQPKSETLLFRAGTGWDTVAKDQFLNNADFALSSCLTQPSEQPLILGDPSNEPHLACHTFLLKQLGVVSGVTLQIGSHTNLFGVIGVFSAYPRDFSKDDMNFLQAVANVLSSAVQRKRSEEEINLLATTDTLTGIANRREFSMQLEKEIERAKRYGTPLSLVMYDIDYFKRVNDTFGHDAGDSVLQTLTEVVKSNIRSVDIVARWGGEEFMILMPQSDGAAAGGAAEKLRQEIVQHPFERVGNLTVSFGVTAFAPQDDSNAFLKRVDDALYQAKENGRNRVEVLVG
ncbi:diguanylate cyclase [Sulfuricurvum sp.]|uniref:GGDEF domain-containing response regulator n=1 Tax=Sulfuricurvum sp. TaxID=2025608 RepID=UPI003C499949